MNGVYIGIHGVWSRTRLNHWDFRHSNLFRISGLGTRVEPEQLDRLLHPHFDPKAKRDVIATGLPASPGAAVGPGSDPPDT